MKAKVKKPKQKKKTVAKFPTDKHIAEERYVDEKGLAIDDEIDHEIPFIPEDIEIVEHEDEDGFEE